MAEGKRIGSKSEDQHQKCAPEYLSCPLRQGEPRQQNVMKILPMQSQVDTNENERRRCEKIMPWLHKLGLLNRRGESFGDEQSGADGSRHRDEQEDIYQPVHSGTQRQTPLKNF